MNEKEKIYRVWHREKNTRSSKLNDNKVKSDIPAPNRETAIKIVQGMFPEHKITYVWLVNK